MVEELIYEKLDYFKTRPLKSDWFSVFIDAYHWVLREDGKMVKVSIFVAVGIDLAGYKHILWRIYTVLITEPISSLEAQCIASLQ